jgi:two-component sensor histidine kinase
MGLFGVAFILMTFGYIAWEQRNRLIQRNENDIRSNAFFLADHTVRLLEITDLTLKQTAALIQGEDWNRIQESKPLWQQLRVIKDALPYIDDIWLTDSTGTLRLTTVQFPAPPSTMADRDAFRAQVASDNGLFIGEPILERVTKKPTFMISRRLQTEDKAFDGIVSVTATLSYLNDYWSKLRLPKGSRITLLRATDGQVIAQHPPPPDGLTFAPIDTAAFNRALLSNSYSGTYTYISLGEERFGAYDQIGDMPFYINVSMPENAYWGPWFVQTRLYGAFALIALLALLALTTLASQQFVEQAATAALLERQVALRTSELQSETAALEVLNRTGSALAAELDIDRIIESVVDASVLLTGARTGAFFYNTGDASADEGGGSGAYYGHYASGDAREAAAGLPVGKLCSAVFADGKTIRSHDITTEPDYGQVSPDVKGAPGHPSIRSIMAVPVQLRTGEIRGVLLFGHEKPGVFTERAERLVTGLAAQAAIALENGRLYQEAQREIEERRQAQTQQSFLIRELHHRVKNTLATVQAVVGATARSASSIEEFYEAFVGRIISLANTHSLLTEAVWQTASLRDILEKELSPYSDDKGKRIALDGSNVELPSEAAVPIGMAIHELTTNAAKYGALSVDAGQVFVSWTSHAHEEGTRLRLSWEERGGPKVSPPQRQGFGSRLLHRVLTTQLNAKVDVDYEPEGLRVAIDAPLKQTASLSPPI